MLDYADEHNLHLSSAKELYEIANIAEDNRMLSKSRKFKLPITDFESAIYDADISIDTCYRQGIKIVSYFDVDNYPQQLLDLEHKGYNDAPLILYYKGDIRTVGNVEGIAIIGTRHPTPEGEKMGEYFGRKFAEMGLNIVSGLALGCDAAAHRGALSANGITTAFLPNGLDIIRPSQNADLASKILSSGGALVSEYPPGTPNTHDNYAERDRLQAGLADATLLIQSDIKKGGSFNAIRTSLENGKPVFAVKYTGSLLGHPMVAGNELLIREGKAKPLTQGDEENVILEIEKSLGNL
jgi:DNA processing protein